MAIPVSELQSLNNKSIIELYSVTLFSDLHGQSSVTRFHSGVGMNSNASIIWQGNTYARFPAIADGFEFSGQGTLPRPTLRVSNILGSISALMVTVNATTPFNDLQGGKFIRHRTMAQFLDAANFPNNSNPFGTPSSSTELPQEIYYINQKTLENREQIIFELVSALDLQNVRVPIRQVLDTDFPGVGLFVG
jgi:lambda family phage minor tail protein L